MIQIFKKEVNAFFISPIGYTSIGSFLIITSLLTWFIPRTNILESKIAGLQIIFDSGPYTLIILCSALTMGLWSLERKSGMMELLLSSPLNIGQILIGKYLATIVIIIFSLVLTLVYYLSVYFLAEPIGNIDSSGIFGSYIGLFFISATFLSIGIFISALNDNQIVSFIITVFVCFFYFWGIELVSHFIFLKKYSHITSSLGGISHYISMRKGVIDTRDIVHFITIISLMLHLSSITFKKKR